MTKVRRIAEMIRERGITPIMTEEPDVEFDGSIYLSDEVHVQVGGGPYLGWVVHVRRDENGLKTFNFMPLRVEIDDLMDDIRRVFT